jgi:hypothetical protein
MTATEQELACLHADLLLLHYQLQLMAGMQEVTHRVQQRQQDMAAATARRDQEAQIWGARTAKQKRVDEAKLEAAGKVPSHAAVSQQRPVHAAWCSALALWLCHRPPLWWRSAELALED